MTTEPPDRPPTAAFLDALEVRRNARIGLVVGLAFTAAVVLFFVVLAPGTTQNPAYYGGLAFVLAMTTAGSVALVLTVRSAMGLAREFEDDDGE